MWRFKLAETRVKEESVSRPLYLFLVVMFLWMRCEAKQEFKLGRKDTFSNILYKAISEENTKSKLTNLIFSPLSLEIVLAVAGLGARGCTRSQISDVIGVPLELQTLHRRYSPILFGIKENNGIVLRIASQIFVDKSYPLREDFVKNSINTLAVGSQELDFHNQPDLARRVINTWVHNKTEGLIKNLFSPGDIGSDTKVILTNAIYFKGVWAKKFNPSFTKPRKFQLADGNIVDVVMMQGEMNARFGNIDWLNAKVLELPYKGGEMSMVILLPHKTSSIAELESRISAKTFDLNEIVNDDLLSGEVDVTIPKFRIELTTKLKGVLKKIGLTYMFSHCADFSGMSNVGMGLEVSKVLQKAFIEVSEEGTEAAAATGLEAVPSSLPPQFVANRPFVFILWDKRSARRVFVGRYAGPERLY